MKLVPFRLLELLFRPFSAVCQIRRRYSKRIPRCCCSFNLLEIEHSSTCEKLFFYQSFTVGTYFFYVFVKKIQSDEIEDLSKTNTFIARSVNAPLKYLLVRNN